MKKSSLVRKICADWHGGKNSSLYQFASSGVYLKEYKQRYISELRECLDDTKSASEVKKIMFCISYFKNFES